MKKTSFNENWIYNGRKITLPHDAMLETGRTPDSPGGSANGFFTGGVYEYKKTFTVPAEWEDKHILLQFEGIYKNAKVYINGSETGGVAYGYIPFFVCLDGKLHYGGENTVKVIADNSDLPNSRWYTGGGIYRPAFLWEGPKDCIEPESVKIDTVGTFPAVIRITSPKTVKFSVAGVCGEGTDFELEIPEAKLWSADKPNLYTATVTCGEDSEEIRFGIRKIEKRSDGLYVNGERTLLRGGCVHHDNGILGSAAYDGAEYRRVKMMKDAGYNAIRSAHNPCSRAMLEACDELGMYMMDESWDMWYHHKSRYDYASDWRENYLSDLKAMVERDYNHPSVILYSIGNEVSEPAKDEGIEKIKEMVEYLHGLDRNRLVTAGFNLMIIANSKKGKGIYDDENGGQNSNSGDKMGGMNSTMFNMITSMVGSGMNMSANGKAADLATSPALDLLDIAGYNYASGRYAKEGSLHPNRIIYGSETFPYDIGKNWKMVEKYPWLVGDFMWTAWDYLGEAGIGVWAYTDDAKAFNKPYPWFVGGPGAIDIIGTPGVAVGHAKAAWRLDAAPWVGVTPLNRGKKKVIKASWRGSNAIGNWSWKDCEGVRGQVEVYSSASRVELILNGKSFGKKTPKNCKAVFKIKYVPGVLTAVAYDDAGNETGRTELTSAGERLSVKTREEIYNGLRFIEIMLADEDGIVECNADRKLKITVENGELLAFGSANPRTEENFLSGEYTTFYGRALAIVKGDSATVAITEA